MQVGVAWRAVLVVPVECRISRNGSSGTKGDLGQTRGHGSRFLSGLEGVLLGCHC